MRERDIVRERCHEAVISRVSKELFFPSLHFLSSSFLSLPFFTFFPFFLFFPILFPFSSTPSLLFFFFTTFLSIPFLPFLTCPFFLYSILFYSILFYSYVFFICPFFSPIHAFSSFFLSFFPFFLSFPFYPLTPVLISTICFVIEMENSLSSPLLSITLSPQGLSADEDSLQ